MSAPRSCPFCDSHAIRLLTGSSDDLIGYRCHQCQNTFYVTELGLKPRNDVIPDAKTGKTPRK